MFSTNIEINKNVVTITGFFGPSFKSDLKRVLTEKKLNKLFITYKFNELSFYEFFALEVLEVLYACVTHPYDLMLNTKAVNTAMDLIEQQTWLVDIEPDKDFGDFDYSVINEKFNFKIKDHQKRWFKEYYKTQNVEYLRGRLLGAEPGLGKTVMSVMTVELTNTEYTLIVAPKPTLDNVWRKTIEEEAYKEKVETFIVGKDKEYNNERYIITHYSILDKIPREAITVLKNSKSAVIVDESHNINEITSKRSTELMELTNDINPSNVLLLSGTPIKARPLELYPLIALIDTRFDKTTGEIFIILYKNPTWYLKPILQKRYDYMTTTILKKELLELPEPIHESFKVKLKDGDRFTLREIRKVVKSYTKDRVKELERDFDQYEQTYHTLYGSIKEKLYSKNKTKFNNYEQDIETIKKNYKKGNLMKISNVLKRANDFEKNIILKNLSGDDKVAFKEAKTIYKYLALKVQGEVLGKIIGGQRIECYKAMAGELDYKKFIELTHKKSVIFSSYIDVCEVAVEKVSKDKYSPGMVFGKYLKNSQTTLKKFTNPKDKMNPIIATYQSLGTGVRLEVANLVILIDMPFRQYVLRQAIDRVHRDGQDSVVRIFQIDLDTGVEDNIHSRNVDIVEWSKKAVEEITGIKTETNAVIDSNFDSPDKNADDEVYISNFKGFEDHFVK
jgi:SNF2 family DNA or RNA helicase